MEALWMALMLGLFDGPSAPPPPCDFDCYVAKAKAREIEKAEREKSFEGLLSGVLFMSLVVGMPICLVPLLRRRP